MSSPPEQMRNLSAIVWLYRGQRDRFLALVKDYFGRLCAECAAVPDKLALFDTALQSLHADFETIAKAVKALTTLDAEKTKTIAETLAELREARKAYDADRASLLDALAAFGKATSKSLPATNEKQHAARKGFDPIAERIKGLIKQVDLLYKLASRIVTTAADLPLPKGEGRGEGELGLRPPQHPQAGQTTGRKPPCRRGPVQTRRLFPSANRLAAGPFPGCRDSGRARPGQGRHQERHRERRLEPHPRPLRRRRPGGGG